jgi:hypothetical protein
VKRALWRLAGIGCTKRSVSGHGREPSKSDANTVPENDGTLSYRSARL